MEVLTLRDWSYTARALIWWRRFATIWNCNVSKGSCSDAWPRGGGIVLGVLCSLQKEGPLYWAARNRSWKVMSRPQALMRPLHLGLPWCRESRPGSTTANSAVTFPSLWRTERFGNNEPKSFFKLLLSSSWSEQSKGNEYWDLKKRDITNCLSFHFPEFSGSLVPSLCCFPQPNIHQVEKILRHQVSSEDSPYKKQYKECAWSEKEAPGCPRRSFRASRCDREGRAARGQWAKAGLWSRHLRLPNACGRYWSLYRAAWETVRRGRNEVSLG